MIRLISIDIAKALCIILVVIGHYVPDNSPGWYIFMVQIIYSFHMPLFMFVSGYVYWAIRKSIEYQKFVWKKFQRLMIPYFFVSVIIISIKLFTEKYLFVQNPTSLSSLYEMFYLPIAGYFLWFVYALFLMFLIIPAFNTSRKLFFLLITSLILYLSPVNFPPIFCLEEFRRMLFYFVLGCCASEFSKVRSIINRKTNVLITLCVFIGIYTVRSYIEISMIEKVLGICIALSGIVLVLKISKMIGLKAKLTSIFLNIAVCSYTIYLFHTTFEGFAKSLLMKVPLHIFNLHETTLLFIVFALIVIAIGVIAPIVLHKIVVKYSKLFSYLLGAKYTG